MANNVRKTLLLLAEEPVLAEWFLDDLGVWEELGTSLFQLGDVLLEIISCPGTPSEIPEMTDRVREADMIAVLARFVDVVALGRLQDVVRGAEAGDTPVAFMLYREEGETDFKMSCPYCGQKLWVRDADVDKRGRCPNCKKGFTLPRQEDHVSMTLQLRDAVQVRKIYRGNPGSISSPLQNLLKLAGEGVAPVPLRTAPLKNSTLRVEVSDESGT